LAFHDVTRLLQHFGSFFANYLPNIDLSPKGLFGSIAKQGCLLGESSMFGVGN
jgi:hypothetical protein